MEKSKKVSLARHRKKDVHTNIMIVEKKMIHTKKNFTKSRNVLFKRRKVPNIDIDFKALLIREKKDWL